MCVLSEGAVGILLHEWKWIFERLFSDFKRGTFMLFLHIDKLETVLFSINTGAVIITIRFIRFGINYLFQHAFITMESENIMLNKINYMYIESIMLADCGCELHHNTITVLLV